MLFYRTELGYSRAWIRLALEQKQLAGHLTTMLRDLPLIRSHYKRYAFLRYHYRLQAIRLPQVFFYLVHWSRQSFRVVLNFFQGTYYEPIHMVEKFLV